MEIDVATLVRYVPQVLFLVAMMVVFWLVVIRPTKVAQTKHTTLIDALVPGDRVITVGGMYGKVVRVGEKVFELEIADGIVLTFDRRAVRRLQDDDD